MTAPTFESGTLLDQELFAEDDNPMLGHIFCSRCYPVPGLGTPSLCGEKLLGIAVPDGCPICEECTAMIQLLMSAGVHPCPTCT